MSTIRPLQSYVVGGAGNYTGIGATSSSLVGMPPPTSSTSTSNVEVYDEGVLLTPSVSLFNFTGGGVAASAGGTAVTVNVPAVAITTQDEGVPLSSTVNTLNFVGAGVTASGAGATTTVTIPGGSGGAPSGFTSTATAAGTTTLTNTSTTMQYFTGTTTQTVVLPVVTTLANGWEFKIVNLSTGLVTVQSSGANTITVLPGNGGWGTFTCINTAGGAGVASWSVEGGTGLSSGFGSLVSGYGASVGPSGSGTAYGSLADASGTLSAAFGAAAVASVSSGTAVGAGATTIDTAHSFGIAANALSVNPGSFGISVNNAAFQLPLYSSLYASTATAAGTTTLTATSAKMQRFSGATTQTCVLPVVTSLANGFEFVILNDSTGAVTVQSSGANTITTLAAAVGAVNRGGWGRFVCVNTAGGTGVASWSYLAGATIL